MTSADTPRTAQTLREIIEGIKFDYRTDMLTTEFNKLMDRREAAIEALVEQAVVEARIEERKHTWKLINDVRYKKVSLDFAKEVSLERLSTLEAEQDIKRIDALTAPSTAKGDKPNN